MGFTPKQLGHLVIKVRDLERAKDFYARVMGLTVTEERPGRMIFMSANTDMSHELAIVSVGDEAPGPEDGRVGLAHMAWQMESFEDLKEMYQRLKDNDIRIKRVSDHGVSLGVYLLDHDDNELEVYYELPKSQWVKENDNLFGATFPWKLEEEPAGVANNLGPLETTFRAPALEWPGP